MVHPSRWFACAALGAGLVAPGMARADVLMGPPACPPGALGDSSHSGSWCAPWPCKTDAECGDWAKCRPWRVCTRDSDVLHGGGMRDPGPPTRMQMVVGTCDAAEKCRGDEETPPQTVGRLVDGAPVCSDGQYCLLREPPVLLSRDAPDVVPQPEVAAPVTEVAKATAKAGCGCDEAAGSAGALGLFMLGFGVRRRRR